MASMIDPGSERAATWRRDDRHSLLFAAVTSLLIVVMIAPDGFDYGAVMAIGTGSPAEGGVISRALWLGLLLFGVFVVGRRAALAWLLARVMNPFLLLFVALAVASVIWSIDPTLTLRRIVRLLTIVSCCIAFVLVSWHPRRFQNVVRPLLTGVLAGSIVFGIVYPELAIHQETQPELVGAWHGLTNHKNSLGALACISLIFWLHGWLAGQVKLLPAALGIAIAATCLALSRSSTSLAAGGVSMLFVLAAMRPPVSLRRYLPIGVAVLVGAVILFALAVLDLVPGLKTLISPIVGLTGKDMTLTGRTAIWAIISEHVRLHPFLGTGYAAYWVPAPGPGMDSYAFVWHMGAFYPGSAHNGYLEVLNDLGWTGLACLIGYLLTQVRQCLQLLSVDSDQAILYLALLFQQALSNVSETHWFGCLSVDFVLMTLATVSIARGLLEYQLRSVFGAPDADRFGPGVVRA
jgi:O-antigen ligase